VNRSSSWLGSALIHGALLIGAGIPFFASYGVVRGTGGLFGSDFECGIREAAGRVDRIDRSKDVFHRPFPEPRVDAPSLLEGEPSLCCYYVVECGPDEELFGPKCRYRLPSEELGGYYTRMKDTELRKRSNMRFLARPCTCGIRKPRHQFGECHPVSKDDPLLILTETIMR
jgi:hypothetical protein